MIDEQRRNLILASLATSLASALPSSASAQSHSHSHSSSHTMPTMNNSMDDVPWEGDEVIGMLIYPGMTVMDLIGPHAMFGSLMGAKIHIVSKTLDPVTSDAGLTVVPTDTFDTCPEELTVLFAPGGTDGTITAATDKDTLDFISSRGKKAKYITSVCSGSIILGAAGLLEGYKATSHWGCLNALAGFGATPVNERVVMDRNRVTGAGVTAGLDFGLSMIAELRNDTYAECTQLMSEYDPQPPFNSGSMATAREEVKDAMISLVAEFSQQTQDLASQYSKSKGA